LLITANLPFEEWDKVFPDRVMTIAGVDRLVHHATIFEMNVGSYRQKIAIERSRNPTAPEPDIKRSRGRPAHSATIKTLAVKTVVD